MTDVEQLIAHEIEADLSSVACNAAVEFDRLKSDGKCDCGPIHALVSLLSEPLEDIKSSEEAGPSFLIAPETLVILHEAFRTSSYEQDITDVATLLERFRGLVEELRAAEQRIVNGQRLPEADATTLGDFCLKLSRAAAATQSDLPRETEPSHPFRG